MSIRYSYGDFTTKGHGVIEYADPSYSGEGKKPKRRSKVKSKFATRWPSASPLKVKSTVSKQKTNKTLHQQAQAIFKQRYPDQQPKKGQIKVIMKELQKSGAGANKPKHRQIKTVLSSKAKSSTIKPTNKIDELALALFKRRFPEQKPQKEQLKEIRQELIEARKKLGL